MTRAVRSMLSVLLPMALAAGCVPGVGDDVGSLEAAVIASRLHDVETIRFRFFEVTDPTAPNPCDDPMATPRFTTDVPLETEAIPTFISGVDGDDHWQCTCS